MMTVCRTGEVLRVRGTMTSMNTEGQAEALLHNLDEYQRKAVTSLRGPVRIIAGAGAGKTRTITHRIAYGCARGIMKPNAVLAVTFSVKAAAEMRERLTMLGVPSEVKASTFHAAALAQLRTVWGDLYEDPLPEIREHIEPLVATALLRSTNVQEPDARTLNDVAAEISWCKVCLIAPDNYAQVCKTMRRTPPGSLSVEDFQDVFEQYEIEKSSRQEIDFNDILLIMCHLIEDNSEIARRVRAHIGWLTVDEYQDVSPLQHRLMRLWLGTNTNICVVGDPAQTIYSFAGATSYYLTDFAREFAPVSADIELQTDYRSTPNIIKAANNVILASPENEDYLKLHPVRDSGVRISKTRYDDDDQEAAYIARMIQHAVAQGAKPGEFAILTRLRDQQHRIARALYDAHLRYRVRKEHGWQHIDVPDASVEGDALEDYGAVTISTIHASKGLEFPHVFIIGCSEGLIPFGSPGQGEALEEERRLMYVAMTRAQDTLHISYAACQDQQHRTQREPSRFL